MAMDGGRGRAAPGDGKPGLEPAEAVREKFLPLTKAALMERLTGADRWPDGTAQTARRFFRYLDYWRQQQYAIRLLALLEAYEPLSPDSDLVMTCDVSKAERDRLQARVFEGTEKLLQQANYSRLDSANIDMILTRESAYGLDLHVDLKAFDRIAIYYRGIGNKTEVRRRLKTLGRKEEFDVPIYRRLCILFKLKPFEARVEEIVAQTGWNRNDAERHVRRLRSHLPGGIDDGRIYMKLFRNIPRSDIEMVFPNTQVRFRLMDKLRLGATAGGGLGFGVFTSAGKVALLASNPLAAAGAAVGLGGVAFRQAMNFVNQKQRYMTVMAQNLYFHSMADNRGVIVKIASRAAEEDIKEEWLLYSVLAKAAASRADLADIDAAIETFIKAEFGLSVDFDIEDALERLIADGVVSEGANGAFTTRGPAEAARHIDAKWDILLDNLPDPGHGEGDEIA